LLFDNARARLLSELEKLEVEGIKGGRAGARLEEA